MLRLDIERLKELVKSLDREFVEIVCNTILESRYNINLPICACITRVKKTEDEYVIRLIDLIGYCVVGNKVRVHMETQHYKLTYVYYKYGEGNTIIYHCNPKYASRLIELLSMKEVERGDYTKPLLRREIKSEMFISDILTKGGSITPYEEWVIDYMGILEVLSGLSGCPYVVQQSVANEYTIELEAIRDKVLKDLRTHIQNHPLLKD